MWIQLCDILFLSTRFCTMTSKQTAPAYSKIFFALLSVCVLGGVIGGISYFIYSKMPVPVVEKYFQSMLDCDIQTAKTYIHSDCKALTCELIRESTAKYEENCNQEKDVTKSEIASVNELNRTVDELFYVEVAIDSKYTGTDKKVKHREITRKYIVELKKDEGDWKILSVSN